MSNGQSNLQKVRTVLGAGVNESSVDAAMRAMQARRATATDTEKGGHCGYCHEQLPQPVEHGKGRTTIEAHVCTPGRPLRFPPHDDFEVTT